MHEAIMNKKKQGKKKVGWCWWRGVGARARE
jgi:hypothetical protein